MMLYTVACGINEYVVLLWMVQKEHTAATSHAQPAIHKGDDSEVNATAVFFTPSTVE